MLVLSVRWWPTPAGVERVLVKQPRSLDIYPNNSLLGTKQQPCEKVSWGLSQWEIYGIPTLPKITFNAIKHAFLARVKLFPPRREIRLTSPSRLSQL